MVTVDTWPSRSGELWLDGSQIDEHGSLSTLNSSIVLTGVDALQPTRIYPSLCYLSGKMWRAHVVASGYNV
jgi:hypothetical protein